MRLIACALAAVFVILTLPPGAGQCFKEKGKGHPHGKPPAVCIGF